MSWSNIKWIFLREVRDQLRDRRTVFTIVVLPLLLYPLLGMSFLQVAQFQREHTTSILLLGAESLPESPSLLTDEAFAAEFCPANEASLLNLTVRAGLPEKVTEGQLPEWAEERIQSGDFDAVVYFPTDFAVKLAAFREATEEGKESTKSEEAADSLARPEPQLFLNTASDKSRIARDRVANVLQRWRETIVTENLIDHHVPLLATKPFQFISKDVARERSRRAAVWSKILPFVVLVWALTGAFYPAIDLCAGEKERGTMETLLCSPAQRSEIVWGKLLTIMTFSIATSTLNLLSMGMTGAFVMTRIVAMAGDTARLAFGAPPLAAVGWLLLALLPLSALFSALSLAIAAFARSSKEGQYYLMPLLMITLPLMMMPMMPSVELDLGMSLIPVTGVMLLLRALIEGQYVEALLYVAPVLAVTALCVMLALRWAIHQFNDESVLFRESEQWGLGIWLRHMIRDRSDTPTVSAALFFGALLLVFRFVLSLFGGLPDSWDGFATVTALSLIGTIGVPALLFAVVFTRSATKTLLLHAPRVATLPMVVLLAIAMHPLAFLMGDVVSRLYPFSPEVTGQLQVMQRLIDQAPSTWMVLLVLAVTPAICEELAFRGFILSGLRHMGHKWLAILVTSVLFGAAHSVIQQSLTACVMGMLLGYIAIQTGSLLPAIVFHCAHNSLSMLLSRYYEVLPDLIAQYPILGFFVTASEQGPVYQWPTIVLSLWLTVRTLQWFGRQTYQHTQEESRQEALDHQGTSVPGRFAVNESCSHS